MPAAPAPRRGPWRARPASRRSRSRSAPRPGRPTAAVEAPSAGADRRGSRAPPPRRSSGRDQPVRAMRDRDRPFRVGPHRQARDVEDRRLLLDPAGIGQHQPSAGHERQERDVPERLHDPESIAVAQPRGLQRRTPARVERDHERQEGRQPVERADHGPGARRVVHVRRPVQRHDPVRLGQPEPLPLAASGRTAPAAPAACRSSGSRRTGSASAGTPLARSSPSASGLVVNSSSASRSLTMRFDLLRHRAVERAQARLDMRATARPAWPPRGSRRACC